MKRVQSLHRAREVAENPGKAAKAASAQPMKGEIIMKSGEFVYTPRFCTVKIEKVIDDANQARSEGYFEPTHYNHPDYDVLGKHTGVNKMTFAAVRK